MLKQLKYFQSVVRFGSVSAAAEENFISQSAISQQVQSLERELGFALLVRKNRSFSLTPAGEYFYRKSLLLTADCDRMCAEAAKIAKGEAANLKIGYLRTYAGGEFHRALAAFSARYPDVSVSITYGSHGELCDMLSEDRVEITLNDQRRLFSDAYENLILAARPALIEVSAHSPIAQMEAVAPAELKNFPCILIAPPPEREAEQEFSRIVLGFPSEFLYAENLEEARLLVAGSRGFLPLEGGERQAAEPLTRVPLVRNGAPLLRTYCASWKRRTRPPTCRNSRGCSKDNLIPERKQKGGADGSAFFHISFSYRKAAKPELIPAARRFTMVVSTKTMRRFWRKAIRKERNNGSIDRILLPRGRELLRRRVPPHFRRQHRKGC